MRHPQAAAPSAMISAQCLFRALEEAAEDRKACIDVVECGSLRGLAGLFSKSFRTENQRWHSFPKMWTMVTNARNVFPRSGAPQRPYRARRVNPIRFAEAPVTG